MIGILKKITKNFTNNTDLSITNTNNGNNQVPVIMNPISSINHTNLLWIENEIPNLKDAVSPIIYQTLTRINELKNKIENDLQSSLNITDQAQIHHLINVDIKTRLLKYLEIPKAQANGVIIRNNKTAKDILNEQLNGIYNTINNILNSNIENKLSEFLTVSNQLTDEHEKAVQKMKLALIPYWQSEENKYDFREYYKQVNTNITLGVEKFIQSFQNLSKPENIQMQMNRIYGIGLHVNQKYNNIEQVYSVSIEDLDYINDFINKTRNMNINDNYVKQNLLVNKVKADIINNKLNDFLSIILENKIIEIYNEDLSILEEVLKQLNATYIGKEEIISLLNSKNICIPI